MTIIVPFCATDLLTVAPGLPDGMDFTSQTSGTAPKSPPEGDTSNDVINLADILAGTDDLDLGDSDEEETAEKVAPSKDVSWHSWLKCILAVCYFLIDWWK